MKLAIVGSRGFLDYTTLKEYADNLHPIEIISGGANGADKLGAKYAKENNLKLTEFLPDWNLYGRAAGIIRNKDIISNCDHALILWDGVSHGTKHDIDLCEKLRKPYTLVKYLTNEVIHKNEKQLELFD